MLRVLPVLVALVLVATKCGSDTSESTQVDIDAIDITQPSAQAPLGDKPVAFSSVRRLPTRDGLAVELVADVTERDTSPGANGEAVNEVVAGINDFGVRFFKIATENGADNVVIGNYSLSTALLMAMAGTNGVTTGAFAELLGVGMVDPAELHPAANAIDLILEGRGGDELDISTANKLFVQDGLALRSEFLNTAVDSYGDPVAVVDFVGAPDDVVLAVNGWVSEQTDGLIEELTTGYRQETVIVLANAMYLKASWSVPFRRLYQSGAFTTADGTIVQTELMAHDQYLPLNAGPDFVAVELPYAGGNLSLVVVQPGDLATFEADLTADNLREITDGLNESGIHLTMPIWSTESSVEALEALHAMGLPHEYDFGAMIEGGEEGLFIDSVSHVARIEVDETGTTAAAASDVAIAFSHGPTVTINQPFFYFVRDRGSGAILFMGRITDPTQSS